MGESSSLRSSNIYKNRIESIDGYKDHPSSLNLTARAQSEKMEKILRKVVRNTMSVRVGINGFGRIGRNLLRACLNEPGLEFVAINDITDAATLGHLLRYDSVHGHLKADLKVEKDALILDGKRIQILQERDPGKLPWKTLGVDIALECSGLFTDRDKAAAHLTAGAKSVLISAPAKGADITLCYGVNHMSFDPARHQIVSNASCTTNCLAPIAKVLHEGFGIKRGLMTTIHSYTNDQRILDLPHSDIRRARAAAMSMIPTSTGAARAVGEVLPHLKGKLDGMSVRVPTPNVSVVDLVAELEKSATEAAINSAMKSAAEGPLKGVLQFCEEELVSTDFNGNPHSSILDSSLTKVMDNNFVKILSWYDNEWGFSNRMRDVALYIGQRIS